MPLPCFSDEIKLWCCSLNFTMLASTVYIERKGNGNGKMVRGKEGDCLL